MMTGERKRGKNTEGSGREVVKVIFWYLTGRTEEDHGMGKDDTPFEIRTAYIPVCTLAVTATLAFSVLGSQFDLGFRVTISSRF